MSDYQLTETNSVLRTADKAIIPEDPANRDRREYNDWLAAGGVPEPYIATSLNGDVDAERERRIATAFKFAGVAYQLDADSQRFITAKGAQAKFAILAGALPGDLRWADPEQNFGWIATDNNVTPMDAQTMGAFADAADLWVSAHIMAGHAIKAMDPIPADYADDRYWP